MWEWNLVLGNLQIKFMINFDSYDIGVFPDVHIKIILNQKKDRNMKKDIIKSNVIANLVFKKLTLIVMSLLLTTFVMVGSLQAAKIRIALAETPSDELAAFFLLPWTGRKLMVWITSGRRLPTRSWQFRLSWAAKWISGLARPIRQCKDRKHQILQGTSTIKFNKTNHRWG